jgi:hypothetical protein
MRSEPVYLSLKKKVYARTSLNSTFPIFQLAENSIRHKSHPRPFILVVFQILARALQPVGLSLAGFLSGGLDGRVFLAGFSFSFFLLFRTAASSLFLSRVRGGGIWG